MDANITWFDITKFYSDIESLIDDFEAEDQVLYPENLIEQNYGAVYPGYQDDMSGGDICQVLMSEEEFLEAAFIELIDLTTDGIHTEETKVAPPEVIAQRTTDFRLICQVERRLIVEGFDYEFKYRTTGYANAFRLQGCSAPTIYNMLMRLHLFRIGLE